MCGVSGEATKASLPKFEALDSRQKERVRLYVEAHLQWNQKMNLTAVREAGEVMERHVEDLWGSFRHCATRALLLVDVGSGMGLPGIVIAIARPDWQVTLLESMKKYCTFLKHAVRINELTNVQDLGLSFQLRECFDVAVARAVAEMRVLVGGLFVAAKGHNPQYARLRCRCCALKEVLHKQAPEHLSVSVPIT